MAKGVWDRRQRQTQGRICGRQGHAAAGAVRDVHFRTSYIAFSNFFNVWMCVRVRVRVRVHVCACVCFRGTITRPVVHCSPMWPVLQVEL
jgi:hypothetical protein